MLYLPPLPQENFIKFTSDEHKAEMLCSWGLISETAKKKLQLKTFKYIGSGDGEKFTCDVVGFIPYNDKPDAGNTAVVDIDGKLTKIMPAYLKEMQKSGFNPSYSSNSEQAE